MKDLEIQSLPEFDDHKLVTFFADKKTGLRAFLAVHNDNLGPATGGTRMWVYPSETDALRDALRLSRAMTYKCALAGVPYGGSKGVIIGDPHYDKTPDLLISYAKSINSLGGVTTGTDLGLTDEDITIMRKVSPYILGVPNGDKFSTSEMATLGVFSAIEAACEEVFDTSDLSGKSFAIKGLGKTGLKLLKMLYEKGAQVIVAEIDREISKDVQQEYPEIKFVPPKEIHKEKVDFYCPCALGGDLTSETVKEIVCKVIVGTANNQLETKGVGDWLYRSGILYIPDYVANAGGLINVVAELEEGGYNKENVLRKVKATRETVQEIIERSQQLALPTNRVADQMAEEIFLENKPISNNV